MFDAIFPKHWTTLQRLMWLKTNALARAVYEIVTGNPVSFTGKAAPLRQLSVAFSPVQNLNGYDAPWPAGGGVNKYDSSVAVANERFNSTGTASASGTTRSDYIPCIGGASYYALNVHGSSVMAGVFWYDSSKTYISHDLIGGVSPASAVVTAPANAAYVGINMPSESANNAAFNYPSTVKTYSPYSNICPISGWSSLTVEQRGVNMWDEEWEVGAIVSGNPVPYASSIRSKNFSPCKPNASLYVKSPNNIIVWWYDRNKAWTGAYISAGNYAITVPADAYYFKIGAPQAYGTTYNNDISINYPSTDHDYHAYNPLSRSISVTFPVVSANKWDEEIAAGYWNHNDNGKFVASSAYTACKSKIPVNPSTTYFWLSPTILREMLFYDENGDYISYTGSSSGTAAYSFTTPANCHYITFYMFGYGQTYNHDIAVNYPATVTTYNPYSRTVYSGWVDVISGGGNGDMGIVDLGDFGWGKDTARAGVFYARVLAREPKSNVVMCTAYKPTNMGVGALGDAEISGAASYGSEYIFVKDTRYENSTGVEFKAAVTGVKALIVLATPIPISLSPQEVQSLLGENNVWSNANQPITVEYRKN